MPRPMMLSDRSVAGSSPSLPAGMLIRPMWMRPRKKVPVVSRTCLPSKHSPCLVLTPVTLLSLLVTAVA